MVPSLFQVPPPFIPSTLQIVSVDRSFSLTMRSDFAAKYARYCPSGDQKGLAPPSVPAIGVERIASSGRSHSVRLPSGPWAANARLRPSGETAGEPGNAVFSGAFTANRITGDADLGRKYITAPTATPPTTTRQAAMNATSRMRNALKESDPPGPNTVRQPVVGICGFGLIRTTGSPGLKKNCSARGGSSGLALCAEGLACGSGVGPGAGSPAAVGAGASAR